MENSIPEFEPRAESDRLAEIVKKLDEVNAEIEKIRDSKLIPPHLARLETEAEALNAELVKLKINGRQ
ncbi:MAG: hypothetical protein KW804_00935 [Candidatus Doudnabacteria bacterium]|nr:hypothetical protein [Candidatus Doudnabacteria bacterium]